MAGYRRAWLAHGDYDYDDEEGKLYSFDQDTDNWSTIAQPSSRSARRQRRHRNRSSARHTPTPHDSKAPIRPSDNSSDVRDFRGFFSYEESIRSNQIRLLYLDPPDGSGKICCTIETVWREQAPEYDALSYEWGSSERQNLITMNGVEVKVTRNLWNALHTILSDSGRHPHILWVDALCINQCDRDEKARQVQEMGSTYRSASRVICWLGKADRDSDRVIDFIKTTAHFLRRLDPRREESDETAATLLQQIQSTVNPDLSQATKNFFRRGYWTRMWIRQEIVLGQDVTLQCGTRKLRWPDASRVCSILSKLMPNLGEWIHLAHGMQVNTLDHAHSHIEKRKDPKWLLQFLERSRSSFAKDPRDKVFGLLGMFHYHPPRDGHRLQVDYAHSFFYVCLDTFKYLCFTESGEPRGFGCLDALAASRPEMSRERLPSWLVDWSSQQRSPIKHLNDYEKLGNLATICQRKTVKARVSPDGLLFNCKGLALGKVQSIGYAMDDPIGMVAAFQNWTEIARCKAGNLIDVNHFLALLDLIFARNGFPVLRRQISALNSGLRVCSWTDNGIELGLVYNYANQRRLVFATSNSDKYLLVPQGAQPGDVLSIIFGCTWPVLLRKQGHGSYKLVGDCYMDQSMLEEAADQFNQGILQSRHFSLE